MLKSEDRTIGRATYRVTQLPSSKGREVLTKLIKLAGPSLSRLLQDFNGEKLSVLDLDTGAVGQALEQLAANLGERDLDYFCEVFGESSVLLQGASQPKLTKEFQDFHFAGEYLEMFKWLLFSLEVNYRGFFPGGLSLNNGASVARPGTVSASISPPG